jgi:hypothetical protein
MLLNEIFLTAIPSMRKRQEITEKIILGQFQVPVMHADQSIYEGMRKYYEKSPEDQCTEYLRTLPIPYQQMIPKSFQAQQQPQQQQQQQRESHLLVLTQFRLDHVMYLIEGKAFSVYLILEIDQYRIRTEPVAGSIYMANVLPAVVMVPVYTGTQNNNHNNSTHQINENNPFLEDYRAEEADYHLESPLKKDLIITVVVSVSGLISRDIPLGYCRQSLLMCPGEEAEIEVTSRDLVLSRESEVVQAVQEAHKESRKLPQFSLKMSFQ